MSEEILDDLDELEGFEKPIVFAKKAIMFTRLSALIYILGIVLPPMLTDDWAKMSNSKFILIALFFSGTGLLAILAVVNAVKSIIFKEAALVKKVIALVIGIFITYMSIISIFNYYLLLQFS